MTDKINLTQLRAHYRQTDSLGGELRWPIDSAVVLALIDTAEAAIACDDEGWIITMPGLRQCILCDAFNPVEASDHEPNCPGVRLRETLNHYSSQ